MDRLRLEILTERWPLAEAFVISRGAKSEAHVVVAVISNGTATGRGEAVPYARYGETVQSVTRAMMSWQPTTDRHRLLRELPAGAARNAIDCALWDLEAKTSRRSPAHLAGLAEPAPLETCYTLSVGSPAAMADKARALSNLSFFKLKLAGAGDGERMRAVRSARPDARLIADANEAWSDRDLVPLLAVAAECGFELIEQPLPAGGDDALRGLARKVTVCADESVHTIGDVAALADRYDAVNIKLDKAGGLTHALEMTAAARRLGLSIMVGSMVATSLAMAPAVLLGQGADWIDLDSPLLLSRDREHALEVVDGYVAPPTPALWG